MKRLGHCCCFTARTGTLIFAVLGVMGGFSNLLTYGGATAGSEQFNQMVNQMDHTFRQWREEGDITARELELYEEYLTTLRQSFPYIVAVGLVCAAVCLVKSSMLLFGVLYKKPCLMLPYIVIGFGSLLFSALVVFALTAMVFLYGNLLSGFIVLAVSGLLMWLAGYFWHVVLSHYHEVKEERDDADRLPILVSEVPPPYEDIPSKY